MIVIFIFLQALIKQQSDIESSFNKWCDANDRCTLLQSTWCHAITLWPSWKRVIKS